MAAEKGPGNIDEKILKKTPAPGAAGLTWGELYEHAAAENELKSGEDFFSYVRRLKKLWEEEDDKPSAPVSKAA
ncbi:MAG: hypothetical protein PHE24_01640 [Patescibacteria group bacterium]|nr:hypothetical protein [Patescibacteria group bacterium]